MSPSPAEALSGGAIAAAPALLAAAGAGVGAGSGGVEAAASSSFTALVLPPWAKGARARGSPLRVSRYCLLRVRRGRSRLVAAPGNTSDGSVGGGVGGEGGSGNGVSAGADFEGDALPCTLSFLVSFSPRWLVLLFGPSGAWEGVVGEDAPAAWFDRR